eukprot:CAMPEP_0118872354 /NCGR_PEP_ID=MMETSP1163-20130328/14570_1 /TAXON_ID=124430 /ORGANISM="Phaeomonas parva, Strain CCMP2877" /LENGTH=80 /DNA_ID=CAMNT_0006807531 /DNA_START=232 /DNA_END=470 /DNA_ORIENTATION=-
MAVEALSLSRPGAWDADVAALDTRLAALQRRAEEVKRQLQEANAQANSILERLRDSSSPVPSPPPAAFVKSAPAPAAQAL